MRWLALVVVFLPLQVQALIAEPFCSTNSWVQQTISGYHVATCGGTISSSTALNSLIAQNSTDISTLQSQMTTLQGQIVDLQTMLGSNPTGGEMTDLETIQVVLFYGGLVGLFAVGMFVGQQR